MRCLLFMVMACFCNHAVAQIPQEMPVPEEHAWLEQFVGDWDVTSMAYQDGEAVGETKGEVSASMFGKFWVVCKHKVETPSFSFKATQTLGYDESKKRYVGTWIDNSMSHMWRYEGSLSGDKKKITLNAKGPADADGKVQSYRDSYEFKSKDLISATSELQEEDGKWVVFMKGEMKRSK